METFMSHRASNIVSGGLLVSGGINIRKPGANEADGLPQCGRPHPPILWASPVWGGTTAIPVPWPTAGPLAAQRAPRMRRFPPALDTPQTAGHPGSAVSQPGPGPRALTSVPRSPPAGPTPWAGLP